MSDRLYNIIHEIAKNNYQIQTQKVNFSILYPNNRDDFKDIVNSHGFVLENIYDNIDLNVNLKNDMIDNIFNIDTSRQNIKIQLIIQDNIEFINVNEQTITANLNNDVLFTICANSLSDEITDSVFLPKLSISRNMDTFDIDIDFDNEWIEDKSRIYPIRFSLQIRFLASQNVSALSIKALSASSDQVYRDTNPDSATQFYVMFYDDSEFRRLKAIYQGKPVCSTVPYAVGDVYNLTSEDIQQWYDGIGDNERNVYLQIIASKPIASNQSVEYDVILPGTIDYLSQEAEFVDTIDGLPIYRGVFPINKNSSPAYVDGIGYLNVYLTESRYKALNSRIQILAKSGETLPGVLSLWDSYPPKDNLSVLESSIIVDSIDSTPPYYSISSLSGRIIINAINGSSPYYGLKILSASVNVALKKLYGINKLDSSISVHSLGISPLLSRIITLSKYSTSYGVNSLNAKLNIIGGPDTNNEWYNANNWEYEGDSIYQQRKFDTINTSYAAIFTKVAGSGEQGSALDSYGNIWSWGLEYLTGTGGTSSDRISITALDLSPDVFSDIDHGGGSYSGHTNNITLALNTSNEIWAWGHDHNILGGYEYSPIKISGAVSYSKIAVSRGGFFIAAIDSSNDIRYAGKVFTIGSDVSSLTVDSTFPSATYTDVCAGMYYILGLTSTGEVYVHGQWTNSSTWRNGVKISGTETFTKIAASRYCAIALKSDGTIWGWGADWNDILGFSNDTTSPQQITSITDTVTDISAFKTLATILCTNNIYVLGGSGSNVGITGVKDALISYNPSREYYHYHRDKIYPKNSWIAGFGGPRSGVIDSNGVIYTNDSRYQNYDSSYYFDWWKSYPIRLKYNDQDDWGGHSSNLIGVDGRLPKLSTYFTCTDMTSGRINRTHKYSMDMDELLVNDVTSSSYVSSRMNDKYDDYNRTYWDHYSDFILSNPQYAEDYINFKYLYMMMNADATINAPFANRSYYPYDKVAKSYVNYPFAKDTSEMFYVKVDYIVTPLINTLSPFNEDYVLSGLNWSETYTIEKAKIGVKVTLYDEISGYCLCNMKTQNINNYSRTSIFTFGISDFGPKPLAADSISSILNTYPSKVKILIQPDMFLYKRNDYAVYNFVSPQSHIEITNIIINPFGI